MEATHTIPLLSSDERRAIYDIPIFLASEREVYFTLPAYALDSTSANSYAVDSTLRCEYYSNL